MANYLDLMGMTATPGVQKSGTPLAGQLARWLDANTVEAALSPLDLASVVLRNHKTGIIKVNVGADTYTPGWDEVYVDLPLLNTLDILGDWSAGVIEMIGDLGGSTFVVNLGDATVDPKLGTGFFANLYIERAADVEVVFAATDGAVIEAGSPTSLFPGQRALISVVFDDAGGAGHSSWVIYTAATTAGGTIVSTQISDSTPDGRALLTSDLAGQKALLGIGGTFDPAPTTSTTIAIDGTAADKNIISQGAAGAVTATLSNSTPDNASGALTKGDDQEVTVQLEAGVQYYLPGVAAAQTAPFKVTGRMTWEVFLLSPDRHYLIGGATNHPQDLGDVVIAGYSQGFDEITGAYSLTKANAPAGCTRANVGGAATWTLPSRVASGETLSRSVVVHNFGSGDITFGASGPTLVGASILAPGESATIEWMREGAGTEHVVVRVTG